MRGARGIVLGAIVTSLVACGSSSDGGSGGAGGGSSSCDAKTLTCGQVVSTADLATIFGQTPTYDESGHPNCNIKLTGATGGGVQVFCAKDYDSMLQGAKQAYPSTTEPNTTGQKSFEIDMSDLSEVGFVTSNGKYAVLVNLITSTANIATARTLAQKVDQNLSQL